MSQIISILTNQTNPGQVYACCGLQELISRLGRDTVESWFDNNYFHICSPYSLSSVMEKIQSTEIKATTKVNTDFALHLGDPFNMDLDWWQMDTPCYIWATSSIQIHRVMSATLQCLKKVTADERLFQHRMVVTTDGKKGKKVETCCFDSRRGAYCSKIDVGFSLDKVKMHSYSSPAIEFLAPIGLQRVQPLRTEQYRRFRYYTWDKPLPVELLPLAITGLIPGIGYEFSIKNRAGYLKNFYPATLLMEVK